jgi:hypothetical protein
MEDRRETEGSAGVGQRYSYKVVHLKGPPASWTLNSGNYHSNLHKWSSCLLSSLMSICPVWPFATRPGTFGVPSYKNKWFGYAVDSESEF